MAKTEDSGIAEFVRDQLHDWAPVSSRRFFSGSALYRGDILFAIIMRDETLYFRTDDANRPDFEAVGAKAFSYQRPGRKVSVLAYHEVPPDILEDAEELGIWAGKAYAAALKVAIAKNKPKRVAKPKPAAKKAKAKPTAARPARQT